MINTRSLSIVIDKPIPLSIGISTCCHPTFSKSSVRKSTLSPSVASNSSSLTCVTSQMCDVPGLSRRHHHLPPGVSSVTGIHESVVVEYFLYSGRCEHSDGDAPETVESGNEWYRYLEHPIRENPSVRMGFVPDPPLIRTDRYMSLAS